MVTPEQIERYVNKVKGSAPTFDEWPANLWTKDQDDIIFFITRRLERTLSEVEYHCCMPFLTEDYPKEQLYVPFNELPQIQQIRSKGIKVATQKVNPTLTPIQPISYIG